MQFSLIPGSSTLSQVKHPAAHYLQAKPLKDLESEVYFRVTVITLSTATYPSGHYTTHCLSESSY